MRVQSIGYISSVSQFIISTLIILLMLFKKLFFFNLEKKYSLSVPGLFELISLTGLAIFGIISFVKTLRSSQTISLKKSLPKINVPTLFLLLLTLVVVGTSIYLNLNKDYIHWDAIALYDARAKFLEGGMKFSDMPTLSRFDNLNKYYYLLYPPYTSIAHYFWERVFDVSKLPVGLYYSLNLLLLAVGVFFLTRETLGDKTAAFLSLIVASNNIIFLVSIKEYTNLPYTLYLVFGIFLLLLYIRNRRWWELLYGTFFISTSIWVRFLEPIWLVVFFSFVLALLFKRNLKSVILPGLLLLTYCLIELLSWSYFVKVVGGNPSVLNFSPIALAEPLLGIFTGAWINVLVIVTKSWGIPLFIYLITLAAVVFQWRKVSKNKEMLFLSLIILLSLALYFSQLYFVSFQADWWKSVAYSLGRSSSFLIPISGYILLRLITTSASFGINKKIK